MSKGAGFIRLTHALVDSPAFAQASSEATRLLILLWRRHNGRNNGAITCSVREAAAWLKCGKSTAADHFAELQQLGLIAITRKGHMTEKGGDRQNVATMWRLTFLPENAGGKGDAE